MNDEDFQRLYSHIKDCLMPYEKTTVVKDKDLESLRKSLNEVSENLDGVSVSMNTIIMVILCLMFSYFPTNWNKEEPKEEKVEASDC